MHTSYKRYWEPSTPQVLTWGIGLGAIGTALTYPIEFVKTRIQIRAEAIGIRNYTINAGYNPFQAIIYQFQVFRQIHATGGGLSQFYQGLDAALTQRSLYLLTRNVVYKFFYDKYKPVKPTNDLRIYEKAMIAGFAGGFAAFLTNPFELITIRKIYEGALPTAQRRGYQGVLQSYGQIVKEEGINGLFKGSSANVLKAIVLNISLTGPYDFLQEKMWICFGDIDYNKPVALLWASVVASLCTLPIDNIKTRLQKQFPDPRMNRITYYGLVDCIQKTVQIEGANGFLVGFYAFYMKTVIYGFFTVYALDVFSGISKKNAGLKEIHM